MRAAHQRARPSVAAATAMLFGVLGAATVACSRGGRAPRSAGEAEPPDGPAVEAGAGSAEGRPDGSAPAPEAAPAARVSDGGPDEKEVDAAGEEGGEPEPPARRVVIQGAGDYILHTRVHDSARFHIGWPGDPDSQATEGYSYLVYRVRPVLAAGDVNLFNLETPLATERNPQSGVPPMLNGAPIAAVSLAGVGFTVASIANNHAYDQEEEGVVETRKAATGAGLLVVGGGADSDEARSPVFVERDGVRIGILAFTESVNRMTVRAATTEATPQVAIWRGEADLETIRSIRRQCDILVVQFHWGGEFDLVPNRSQRNTAAALCSEGVDLVLGTHSHTLQQVARYDGPDESSCVVAYSLGNFLSNQGLKYRVGWSNPDPDRAQGIPYTRDGAIVRVAWEEDPEGRMQVASIQAVPLWGENNWLQRFGVRDFQNDVYVAPLYASMADPGRSALYAELYEERLAEIRKALGSEVEIVRQ